MPKLPETLARALELLASACPRQHRRTAARHDEVLRTLVGDLIAARTAAGMTQNDVAMRMLTSKSAVSRLESGRFARPSLATVEKYARAVNARVEIRLRPRA